MDIRADKINKTVPRIYNKTFSFEQQRELKSYPLKLVQVLIDPSEGKIVWKKNHFGFWVPVIHKPIGERSCSQEFVNLSSGLVFFAYNLCMNGLDRRFHPDYKQLWVTISFKRQRLSIQSATPTPYSRGPKFLKMSYKCCIQWAFAIFCSNWTLNVGFQRAARALPLCKGMEASPSRVPTIIRTYCCTWFNVMVC